MSRPRTFTIAAILMVLYSLLGAVDTLSTLAQGAPAPSADAPPFALTVISFILAVLGIVGAYGVWLMQKWGVLLTIVVASLNIVASLPAIILAPMPLRLVGALGVVWSATIIVLLLRRIPTPVEA